MGEVQFGQTAKVVIQRHLNDSDFIVQALDRAAGQLASGPKPVQQERLVGTQHARRNAAAHTGDL